MIDISKSTLIRYEGYKSVPTPFILSNIAKALEVDLKDITGDYIDKRNANVILGKSGSGSNTAKISIPVTWLEDMGIDEDNKAVIISYY